MSRIVVIGGPRTGKTTLATKIAEMSGAFGIPCRHTDDLIADFEWSAASAEVAKWLDSPGPWVIEGVAVVRALRKWLAAHPEGLPFDELVHCQQPFAGRTQGQLTMGKGHDTVWREVLPLLEARGYREGEAFADEHSTPIRDLCRMSGAS